MEYLITLLTDKGNKVLSKHDNLEEAMTAGRVAFDTVAEKGDMVNCVSGNIDKNGKMIGKYRLYKSWF